MSEHQDADPSSGSSALDPDAEYKLPNSDDFGGCDECTLEAIERDISLCKEGNKNRKDHLLAAKFMFECKIRRKKETNGPHEKHVQQRSNVLEEQVPDLLREGREVLAEASRMIKEFWDKKQQAKEQYYTYTLGEGLPLKDSEELATTSMER